MTEEKSIHDKIISIQQELRCPKSQYNDHGKYKFRSCEDILEAVKPLLNKHGLFLVLSDEIEAHGAMVFVCGKASVTDGEKVIETKGFAKEADTQKGMNSAQVTGSSSSYARKYALNGMFLIDDNKDMDSKESNIIEDALEEEIDKIETVKDLEAYYLNSKGKYSKNMSVFNRLISDKKAEIINENS